MSIDYRKYDVTGSGRKRKRSDNPRPYVQATSVKTRHRKTLVFGKPSKAGLECRGPHNLMAYIRKKDTRQHCRFCGKKRQVYYCTACGETFCMSAPVDLTIPGSNPPRKFRKDGPFCAHRIHGYMNWTDI